MTSGEHTIHTRFKLQCKNVSILTCSGVRLALFLEALFPAAEKSRSEGVDVAGMHKKDLASDARAGNLASFDFHQDRGLSVFERGCSPKYISTSLLIICLCASSSLMSLSPSVESDPSSESSTETVLPFGVPLSSDAVASWFPLVSWFTVLPSMGCSARACTLF